MGEVRCPECGTEKADVLEDSFKIVGSGPVAAVLRCLQCGHEFAIPREQLPAPLASESDLPEGFLPMGEFRKIKEGGKRVCKKCGAEIVPYTDSDGDYFHPYFMGYCPECEEAVPFPEVKDEQINHVLKCSACKIKIPIEPIVARLMMDNMSNQSWCSSCGASDTVTLVREGD